MTTNTITEDGLPEFLSVETVARIMGVHANTVHNWVRADVLPSTLVGGRRLFPRKFFEQLAADALNEVAR